MDAWESGTRVVRDSRASCHGTPRYGTLALTPARCGHGAPESPCSMYACIPLPRVVNLPHVPRSYSPALESLFLV